MSCFPAPAGDLVDGDLTLHLARTYSSKDSPWGVPAYAFRLLLDGEDVGHLNLRISSTVRFTDHAGQVGYSVATSHRGRGLAGRALAMVRPLARANGLAHLWITCDLDNRASIRVLEKAGAEFVEITTLPAAYARRHGVTQKRRYCLEL